MPKFLKRLLIALVLLGVLGFLGLRYMQSETKKASPETAATFSQNELNMEVRYSGPYKKGREIFGGLVPYDEVWRTGANEATTFSTDKNINFGGASVKAGTYTLWTIPGKDSWSVILNDKRYGWGVSWGGVASREPAHDAATVNVAVNKRAEVLEQFNIRFQDEPLALVLEWDDVMVAVPITQ